MDNKKCKIPTIPKLKNGKIDNNKEDFFIMPVLQYGILLEPKDEHKNIYTPDDVMSEAVKKVIDEEHINVNDVSKLITIKME